MPSPTRVLRFRRKRVLIVSDHPDTSEMYAMFLQNNGFDTDTATYASAAARAFEWRPDVLTADLGMPFNDAFDVCRRVREHPVTHRVPIVALTGHASDQMRTDAASAGCGKVLLKPVAPERFLREIYRALGIAPVKK